MSSRFVSRVAREKYNVDYVLFDADASVCEEEFKTYDW